MTPVISPRKLIETGLPLDKINVESLRRKQKAPKGWPTSFHKWWAQRPIAAARAVIFGQMVNDPSWRWEIEHPDETPPNHLKATWAKERARLFRIIEEVVLWDNSNNSAVRDRAHKEILRSWQDTCDINAEHPSADLLFDRSRPPILHDPFAGSGTIPLEGQRLGLEVLASDLNPVAVMINSALMDYPRRFYGQPPVFDAALQPQKMELQLTKRWPRAAGLAEDVRNYTQWIRDQMSEDLRDTYPRVLVTTEMASGRSDLTPYVGRELTVTAWIWARTVHSPNPAFRHIPVPLASTFVLSLKGEGAFVEPIVGDNSYTFKARASAPPDDARNGTKLARGANFRCIMSDTPIPSEYVKAEGQAGRLGARLMAIVAEADRGRIYLDPTPEHEAVALQQTPDWRPAVQISGSTQYLGVKPYGMHEFSDLFTDRQLVGLSTVSKYIGDARALCLQHAAAAGLVADGVSLEDGGKGANAYADAIAVYLAFTLDRMTFYGSTLCGWLPKDNAMRQAMPQQAMAMTWDYAEGNPLAKSSADITTCSNAVADCLDQLTGDTNAFVIQKDARDSSTHSNFVVSTDPPYYDNVPYSDLSDYFYVWMRHSLRDAFPRLFSTVATPKQTELVAFGHRHSEGKNGAEAFFLTGMTAVMENLAQNAHPAFPVTIYYAFKQSETDENDGTSSPGWVTFLEAVLKAGFMITGTWPMRTEGEKRVRAAGSNALASSIVLVCRKRHPSAESISRRAFTRQLNNTLPSAIDLMTLGAGEDRPPIAPVDLSQAIIGPGMAIFSRYSSVLEADGSPMTVDAALRIINRFLAGDDFDPDTQFCLSWFEQHGWTAAAFGEADQLARAKGTAVNGVQAAGVIEAAAGIVRLLKWADYPADWDPAKDARLPVWEVLHHLIRLFKTHGEAGAGALLAKVSGKADAARQLAYRLYTLCERSNWTEDARAYNEIMASWGAIENAAAATAQPRQTTLFDR
jgi:putative DNA methylase